MLLDFLANVNEAVIRLFGVFLRFPVFKIHVPAAFVDVIGYHPGQRGNVAVPGPMRLGRVAIPARMDQGRVNVFGDVHMSG